VTNETVVECIKRIYRITVPGVATIEMESNNILSVSDTVRLIQEELGINDVISVFRNLNIIDVKMTPSSILELISAKDVEQPRTIRLLSSEDVIPEKDEVSEKGDTEGYTEKGDTAEHTEKDKKPDNTGECIEQDIPTPLQRLNYMIQIEGEFTREDYIRFLEDKKVEISQWISHDDINRALILKKIERTEKRRPKEYVKYKVIDSDPIDEDTYQQTMRKYKVKEKR
jgi:hypothetical protein